MKHFILILICSFCLEGVWGQKSHFSYDFYGFIRGDLFYNTRQSVAPVDGNFYLFPLDVQLDAEGNDLNKAPIGNFYAYTSRLGLNVKGPMLGKARTSANIEVDFGGGGGLVGVLRLRKAYLALDWSHHQLLLGQTWHPLFGAVLPDILNLSTGAPFQPFNRSPQIRYQYRKNGFNVTASALWQMQYTSRGPSGPSSAYMKHGGVPEFYLGVDWTHDGGWLLGAGVHMLSIRPRMQSEWQGKTYRVKERMTTTSYEAHARYKSDRLYVAGKTLLASALDHSAMLGGYGICAVNPVNGEQQYTAFHHSTSWLNITYGKVWKPSLFLGYTKNLGTGKELVAGQPVYGVALDVDQLLTTQLGFSYNLKHWQFGLEASVCSAWYGDIQNRNGRIVNTHVVNNCRVLGLAMFYF